MLPFFAVACGSGHPAPLDADGGASVRHVCLRPLAIARADDLGAFSLPSTAVPSQLIPYTAEERWPCHSSVPGSSVRCGRGGDQGAPPDSLRPVNVSAAPSRALTNTR